MKLICLGDSTMQLNDESTYPQVGWPQALMGKLNGVEIIDLAKNGRSTKSYIDEGLFEDAKRYIDEDSVVLIEFGHNDEHSHQPERFTRPVRRRERESSFSPRSAAVILKLMAALMKAVMMATGRR